MQGITGKPMSRTMAATDWFMNEKKICRDMGHREMYGEPMRKKLVDLLMDDRLLTYWAWHYPSITESHRYLATNLFVNCQYNPRRFKKLIGVTDEMIDKALSAMFPDLPNDEITPKHVGAVLRRIEVEAPDENPYTGDEKAAC